MSICSSCFFLKQGQEAKDNIAEWLKCGLWCLGIGFKSPFSHPGWLEKLGNRNFVGKISVNSGSWPRSWLSFYQDKLECIYNENIFTLLKEYQVLRAVEHTLPVSSISSQPKTPIRCIWEAWIHWLKNTVLLADNNTFLCF